nr:uncharacterized protein LOC109733334 [Aegilops tauschii subsp. strangulata]
MNAAGAPTPPAAVRLLPRPSGAPSSPRLSSVPGAPTPRSSSARALLSSPVRPPPFRRRERKPRARILLLRRPAQFVAVSARSGEALRSQPRPRLQAAAASPACRRAGFCFLFFKQEFCSSRAPDTEQLLSFSRALTKAQRRPSLIRPSRPLSTSKPDLAREQ